MEFFRSTSGSIVAASKKTRSKSATTGDLANETTALATLGSRRLSVSVLHSGKTLIPRPVTPSIEVEDTPNTEQQSNCAHTSAFLLHITTVITDCLAVCTDNLDIVPSSPPVVSELPVVSDHSNHSVILSALSALPTAVPATPPTPSVPALSYPNTPTSSVSPLSPAPFHSPVLTDSNSTTCDSSSDNNMGNAIVLCDGIEIPKVLGLPRVTASILTPYILRELEDYVEVYLEDKAIVDKRRRLKKIAGCFANSEHMKWVNTEAGIQPAGTTLTEFMDKIRNCFLPDNWELEIHNDREADLMKKNDKFVDSATRVKKKNSVLVNTAFHLDNSALCMFLQSHLCEDLMRLVFETPTASGTYVYALTDFTKWEHEVQRLDNFRRRQQKAIRDVLADAEHIRNTRGSSSNAGKSRKTDKKSSSSSTDLDRCPTLTDNERRILREFDGCFKCCKVLQTHVSRDCTAPFPQREGYCPVQKPAQSDVDAFNKKKDSNDKRPSSSSSTDRPAKKQKKEAAASIVPSERDASDDSADSDTIAFLREEGDTTHSDVCGRHLYWDCCVLAPNNEFPVKTTALLDCGAHVVLIHDTLVDELGLKRQPLMDTFSVRGAVSSGRSSLKEFVALSLSSPDLYYTAHTVKALIVNELSSPIILGMPFLMKNKIVIDNDLRIVTDKKQQYNLLGPNDVSAKRLPKQKHVPLREKKTLLRTTAKYRKRLLDDLKEQLLATKLAMQLHTYSDDARAVAAAIQERITSVIDEEVLRHLHDKITQEFAPVFAAMPDVTGLPNDIEAEINLMDPTKTVKPRTYSCPRHYKQAWKRLIDEHLDAGRIRPSDSPHASPSFCIPKADPDAPPQWVNDYRELNCNTIPDNYTLPKVDDVLNDCAQGKFFAVIDMTSAFFQTKMRASDIGKTAVSTPFGSYEWVVMPMGLRNAPAIHQRRINRALRPHIGKICRVYLDDIVIWSQTLDEHEHNVWLILQTLNDAGLYCNLKKTKLFCTEVHFLGHKVSARASRPMIRKLTAL
jgi:hypothetical protein